MWGIMVMDEGRRNRDTKPGARRDSRRDISGMTEEEIRAMVDEMFQQNKEWLTQFK